MEVELRRSIEPLARKRRGALWPQLAYSSWRCPVVDAQEERGVTVVGSALEEQLVDGIEEARKIVEGNGVAAAEIGLKIGHQESAGNSLSRNVGENEGKARGTEIEEVVVVTADLARLHARSSIFECGERRTDLREKAELDVAGDVHFVQLLVNFRHAVGDVLRETNVLKGDLRISSGPRNRGRCLSLPGAGSSERVPTRPPTRRVPWPTRGTRHSGERGARGNSSGASMDRWGMSSFPPAERLMRQASEN